MDNDGFIFIENYDKKKVLEFTKYIIENCDVNLSVKTRQKWWLNEKSQAGQWIEFYKFIIDLIVKDLQLNFSRYDFTPFHLSCLFGYKEMVQMLTEYGCDILCMGCKSICKNCPYVMKVFLERKDKVDLCLDKYFGIGYTESEITEMESRGIIFEIDEIAEFVKHEVLWFLFEEERFIKFDSLQYDIIEYIAEKTVDSEYIANIEYLPETVKRDIDKFIEFKYY